MKRIRLNLLLWSRGIHLLYFIIHNMIEQFLTISYKTFMLQKHANGIHL